MDITVTFPASLFVRCHFTPEELGFLRNAADRALEGLQKEFDAKPEYLESPQLRGILVEQTNLCRRVVHTIDCELAYFDYLKTHGKEPPSDGR